MEKTAMTPDRETLLPCPFCGSDAKITDTEPFAVECTNESCLIDGPCFGGRADAIAAWNRRSAPTVREPVLLAEVLRSRGRNNSLHDINRAADFLATAPVPPVSEDAVGILSRLVSRLEYFDRAPDDAVVWIGGWSTPDAYTGEGTVSAGEIRAAIEAAMSTKETGRG